MGNDKNYGDPIEPISLPSSMLKASQKTSKKTSTSMPERLGLIGAIAGSLVAASFYGLEGGAIGGLLGAGIGGGLGAYLTRTASPSPDSVVANTKNQAHGRSLVAEEKILEPAERLLRVDALRKQGLISEEEREEARQKILADL